MLIVRNQYSPLPFTLVTALRASRNPSLSSVDAVLELSKISSSAESCAKDLLVLQHGIIDNHVN